MKYFLFSFLSLFFGSLVQAKKEEPPRVVKELNISSYMGLWYEVARIDTSFQKNCIGETTAHYELDDDDEIKVTNKCAMKRGRTKKSTGRARVNPDLSRNSQLQVTFVKFIFWIFPWGGDYWVLDTDTNHKKFSIVGSPSREYLWILSRDKTMNLDDLRKHEETIRKQGYDTTQIRITQEGDLKGEPLSKVRQK